MQEAILGIFFILLGQIVTALFGAIWLQGRVRRVKQAQALKRFKDEPYAQAGVVYSIVKASKSAAIVCDRCIVHSIIKGRIEVRLLPPTGLEALPFAMFWTLAEFEEFDPVVELSPPVTSSRTTSVTPAKDTEPSPPTPRVDTGETDIDQIAS